MPFAAGVDAGFFTTFASFFALVAEAGSAIEADAGGVAVWLGAVEIGMAGIWTRFMYWVSSMPGMVVRPEVAVTMPSKDASHMTWWSRLTEEDTDDVEVPDEAAGAESSQDRYRSPTWRSARGGNTGTIANCDICADHWSDTYPDVNGEGGLVLHAASSPADDIPIMQRILVVVLMRPSRFSYRSRIGNTITERHVWASARF